MKKSLWIETRASILKIVFGVLVPCLLCSCDVTNPGNIIDEDIYDTNYMEPLLNGAITRYTGSLAGGDSSYVFAAGALFGEIYPCTTYQEEPQAVRGDLPESHAEWSDQLDEQHGTRWLAEECIRRMQLVMKTDYHKSALAAEANLIAGLANRILGSTFCHAVFDGGPLEDRIEYFKRAESQFSEAIDIAQAAGNNDLLLAAYGGRASVRIVLGQWTEAVADAGMVPDDFSYQVNYKTTSGNDLTNTLWYQVYIRNDITMKLTWFEDYYTQSGGVIDDEDDTHGDPRVAMKQRYSQGKPVTGADTRNTPILGTLKASSGTNSVAVIKGTEMRLIEAEAMIREVSTWQEGLQIINDLRENIEAVPSLLPWTAATQDEAFKALVRERAIVLWNEGRRGADLYRWSIERGYQPSDDEIITTMVEKAKAFGYSGFVENAYRAICFPISEWVRSTNPNID